MPATKQFSIFRPVAAVLATVAGFSFQHHQLLSAIRQAKQQGLTEVRLPPAIVLPTGVETTNEILRDYAVLRFEVVDRITLPEDAGLRTWYKIKVLETISPQARVDEANLPAGAPSQLLPLAAGEALYVHSGGVAEMEGIRVVQGTPEPGLALQEHQQYVGFFFLEYSGKLASLAAGAAGLFVVSGNELKPQGGETHRLVKEIREAYGNRLDRFREDIQQRIGAARE